MAAVQGLLRELEIDDRPTLLVLNKIDRVHEPRAIDRLVEARGGVPVSAVTGGGFDHLRSTLEAAPPRPRGAGTLRVPHGEGTALALLYARGRVLAPTDHAGHRPPAGELPPS